MNKPRNQNQPRPARLASGTPPPAKPASISPTLAGSQDLAVTGAGSEVRAAVQAGARGGSHADCRRLVIQREPLGHVYVQLLDFARGYCATATLWVPEETLLDARCSAALAALKPLLLKTERAPAGTIGRPVGGPTLLHTYQYDLGLVRRLQRLATRLYAWKLPLLPADLHLWRADGRPWLVSSGQEASGAVLLTLGEEHAVARALPGLHLRWDPLAAIAS